MRECILPLDRHGISGFWMNDDDYDDFNVVVMLEHREDAWESIIKYFGPWKAQLWHTKLSKIAASRQYAHKVSLQSIYARRFNLAVLIFIKTGFLWSLYLFCKCFLTL